MLRFVDAEKRGSLSPFELAGWAAWIEAAARGDHTALASFYDATSRLVYGLALKIVRDARAAEEVTLDVYAQVWRTAASFEARRGSALTWLLTMARSRALDFLRARSRRKAQPLSSLEGFDAPAEEQPDPQEASALAERRALVKAAIAELTTEQSEALELAFFGGLSHSEIAERIGKPLGTVKTRIRLGLARLRDRLGPVLEAS